MKIEKINDNQIKMILTQADLKERNLKLQDLTDRNEKTTAFFHDLMERAMKECNFEVDNTQIMIEAMPLGLDGIMLIVTKMDQKSGENDQFKMLSQSKEFHQFKRSPMETEDSANKSDGQILVYSFPDLDTVIDVSHCLWETYCGESSLYKNQGRYFLTLQQEEQDKSKQELDLILSEYGKKHISNELSKCYLLEHGEVIMQQEAIQLLGKNL